MGLGENSTTGLTEITLAGIAAARFPKLVWRTCPRPGVALPARARERLTVRFGPRLSSFSYFRRNAWQLFHAVVWLDHHSAQVLEFDAEHVEAKQG